MTKIVLITGAANGLGAALTKEFLSRDWWVIATDVDENIYEIFKDHKKAWSLKMDITSGESVNSAFNEIHKENITLDLIINNAGIDRYFPFSEEETESFKMVFEVNLFGSYRINRTFLPILNKPGGRILHIGSESLNLTIPFMPYPLSKNALERYSKVLRQELKFQGIDVVVIRPGAIRTGLLENVLKLKSAVSNRQSAVDSRQSAVQMQKFAEDARKNIGKILEPKKVAEFIFKVSQKSNPKAVYKINNSLQLKIAALLPFSLVEKLVRKRLKG